MVELSQNSLIQDLVLYKSQLKIDCLVKEAAQAFEFNPLLPGVILTENHQFLGMLSRRRFLEHMSRPYGLEVFLGRSLRSLYRFAGTELLIVSCEMPVIEVASLALQRSSELLYEPIVVKFSDSDHGLIDPQQVLIAQSEILQQTTSLLNQLYQKLEKANQQLQRLASSDGLTGLANRRLFDLRLQQEWRRLARDNQSLSLILCDVDYFKAYNDTYGHQAGDRCLQGIARLLQSVINRPADLAARYGGEEFALILPNTQLSGAVHIAKRLQAEVAQAAIAHQSSSVSPYVTLSLGISCQIPLPKHDPLLLIEAADQALYQAKAEGRSRYCINVLRA